MKLIACTGCGSKELDEEDGVIVCIYCQSKYVPQADDAPPKETVVGITSDVEVLLGKCRSDPINRQMYANLVLDIDPTNREARQYLL